MTLITDDNEVAVVKLYYAEEELYREGFKRFEDAPDDLSGEDAPDPMIALSNFRESATWANIVHPKIRAAAGYGDGGHGTYQINREVAVVAAGCEEDRPARAGLVTAAVVEHILLSAWERGAFDALDGRDADPSRIDSAWHDTPSVRGED